MYNEILWFTRIFTNLLLFFVNKTLPVAVGRIQTDEVTSLSQLSTAIREGQASGYYWSLNP